MNPWDPHPHYCTGISPTVHVLTFNATSWDYSLFPTEGVSLTDPDAKFGVLGIFHSRILAMKTGEEWVDRQLKDLRASEFDTEEKREEARKNWWERIGSGQIWDWNLEPYGWLGGICCWAGGELQVLVEDRRAVALVERVEWEKDEEEKSEDSGNEDRELGGEDGREKGKQVGKEEGDDDVSGKPDVGAAAHRPGNDGGERQLENGKL